MVYFKDYPYFKPDFTPKQMFEKGIYGGCYFRPIYSTVNNKKYTHDWKKLKCLQNLHPDKFLLTTYDKTKNCYKVKAGQTLEFWEEHGWIEPIDPRGWIEFYCKFYEGRRSYDDKRQIKRALGVLVRFGQTKMTPKIKQTLLHWGFDPEKDHSKYIEEIKKNKWLSV
jgi:hypothetical protein